ncbi:MAG: GNAT family N-acetyltransferase [Aureliella sp.]
MLVVRKGNSQDYVDLAEIMFDAVRNGRSHYTELQRQAWVPHVRSGKKWEDRLASQEIFVASDTSQRLGFMSLTANGYIDFAYVRPAAQGTGVFRRMYEKLESVALHAGESRLWTHASLMAEPAFAAVGFHITNEETVKIGDQELRRFEMEKRIDGMTT